MDDGKMTGTHQRPWPYCDKQVNDWYWGCIDHWSLLPWHLRAPYINARRLGDSYAAAETSRNLAEWAEIRHWQGPAKSDLSRADPILKPIDELPLAVAVFDSPKTNELAAFASGVTTTGDVFLFWPRTGEYFTITKDEAKIVLRGIRAMLTGGY